MISLVGKDCEESAQGPPGTWKWLNLFISEREGMGREGKGQQEKTELTFMFIVSHMVIIKDMLNYYISALSNSILINSSLIST